MIKILFFLTTDKYHWWKSIFPFVKIELFFIGIIFSGHASRVWLIFILLFRTEIIVFELLWFFSWLLRQSDYVINKVFLYDLPLITLISLMRGYGIVRVNVFLNFFPYNSSKVHFCWNTLVLILLVVLTLESYLPLLFLCLRYRNLRSLRLSIFFHILWIYLEFYDIVTVKRRINQ